MSKDTEATTLPLCDLVMKGGITSGIVYPRLLAELARSYRFKNIGGTSAGAIAAAACAAAEHARQTGGPADAFDRLKKLPDELKQRSGDGHSMLFHLFQPAPAVRRHFAVLVSMLNAKPLAAAGNALLAMVRQFWGFALLGVLLALVLFTPVVQVAAPALPLRAAVGIALATLLLWWLWAAYGLRRLASLGSRRLRALLLWWGVGLVATGIVLSVAGRASGGLTLWWAMLAAGIAAPLTIALVLALAGLRFGMTMVAGMHGNGYGLCSGRTANEPAAQELAVQEPAAQEPAAQEPGAAGSPPPGLTDWLCGYLDSLAGHSGTRPLAFGDLWGASFDKGLFADVEPAARRINLEVMTSAISQRMCYAIPLRRDQGLYYDPLEWAQLFPPRVMQWLEQASRAEAGEDQVVHGEGAQQRLLSVLPSNANIPVVVAVRMSLSFPALLSAVPLYAVDFSLKKNQAKSPLQATRIWFSDGGIASNMPLHFFDSPLPGHPTFAVNLKAEHPDYQIDPTKPPEQQAGRVYLPRDNQGGTQRHWTAPADTSALGGLLGFFSSIVDTMQNWRDELQFPYPGYRDRIVQISQRPDEGGLNLDMPERNIENLSAAGSLAAGQLLQRFHDAGGGFSEGWRNHRQLRLRILLGVVEELACNLQASFRDGRWAEAFDDMPDGTYTQKHRETAERCLEQLDDVARTLAASGVSFRESAPRPRASMRIAPRI